MTMMIELVTGVVLRVLYRSHSNQDPIECPKISRQWWFHSPGLPFVSLSAFARSTSGHESHVRLMARPNPINKKKHVATTRARNRLWLGQKPLAWRLLVLLLLILLRLVGGSSIGAERGGAYDVTGFVASNSDASSSSVESELSTAPSTGASPERSRDGGRTRKRGRGVVGARAAAGVAFVTPPPTRRNPGGIQIHEIRGGGKRLGPPPTPRPPHDCSSHELTASSSSYSASPPPPPTTTTAVQIREAFEEALAGHRSCYTWALRGFVVDCLTELPSLLVHHHVHSWHHRLERILAVASLLWKLSLAIGVYQFSQSFAINHRVFVDAAASSASAVADGNGTGAVGRVDVGKLQALVESSHRHMGRLWRRTALLVAAETAAEVGRAWAVGTLIAADKGLRTPLTAATILGTAVAVSGIVMGIASARQFRAWETKSQEGAALGEETLRRARSTYRDLGLCAGALLARAAATPVRAVALFRGTAPLSPLPIVAGLLPVAAALRTRLKVAMLLRELRDATWHAFRTVATSASALSSSDPKSQGGGLVVVGVPPDVVLRLYVSQARFFDRVGDVFREEAAVKVLAACVAQRDNAIGFVRRLRPNSGGGGIRAS